MLTITELYTYPVKSFKANPVEQICMDSFGPAGDRRLMLVDACGKFVTQRTHPKMATLSARLEGRALEITLPETPLPTLRLSDFIRTVNVTVWGEALSAKGLGENSVDHMLSEFLGTQVRLVYMPQDCFRQVDRAFFNHEQRVSFADGFPVLLTNQASLDELNSRLSVPVQMARFRPNIVVAGDMPYQEDQWQKVKIGDVVFDVVKPCSRCVMTTVNEFAEKTAEPLRTLSSYRRNEYGVCFGQNLVHRGKGRIQLGDELVVIE